ncbi:HAMP domain-containing sensor histidine kinase [uncultured Sphingomonas sp.]|uniref:sensor histidine kinase n=1 Tax=uncultured Sphingomonas sp. TaxID=158754 RepID=UPI0025F0D70A|nr:HAMP domain-containing sensor histidine kinase [uncultured Sphingomonas sp.]
MTAPGPRPLGRLLLGWLALAGGVGIALTTTVLAIVAGRNAALWSAVAGGVLLLILLATLRITIARYVTNPLRVVAQAMTAMAAPGEPASHPMPDAPAEIRALLLRLALMRQQVQEQAGQRELRSFRLGRTESRAALVHNARNALSPISTILSHGLAQPPVAERDMIERVVAELARHDLPPARREKLAAFLMTAIDAVARARMERLAQFETGRAALANILDIIGGPQDVADEGPVLDRCDVTDLIARNGAIARYGDGRSIAVSFPATSCWVRADRVILSQVIGNLFRNAVEAIAARGDGDGQVIVTVTDGPEVTVVIADDGDGFDPADAPMLFQHGYSTRKAKAGGLGLHWCANWMAAMGGRLRLDSDGPGLGARAILTLPAG